MFITCLASDIHALKGKKMEQGDIDMMLKRLCIFRFAAKLQNPDTSIYPCGTCFAKLVLGSSDSRPQVLLGAKRPPQGTTGATPEGKRQSLCIDWSVDQVVASIEDMGLGHVTDAFRHNAVDGRFLTELSQEELVSELGLTSLQAKKVFTRLVKKP